MNAANPMVGKLRPTQVISQHGPGAVVDLPELSVVIASLDAWEERHGDRVTEPRLEAFLGADGLYRPPRGGGVPAYVFPEWLVCPHFRCRLLAPTTSFDWLDPPAGEFVCRRTELHGSTKRFAAFPARFMVACPRGHLDDFPWHSWIHGGQSSQCDGPLRLEDWARSGSVSDLRVECEACDAAKTMRDVFEPHTLGECTGRRPWFGPANRERGCEAGPWVILRGASNAYFSVVASALSIPPYSDPIQLAIEPYLEILSRLDTPDKIASASDLGLLGDLLEQFTAEQVLEAVRGGTPTVERLRPDEYRAFLDPPMPAQPPHQFEVEHVGVPTGRNAGLFETVAEATRLREVRALRGFTRIESGFDIGELADVAELQVDMAPLGPARLRWRPAVELRGEGVFLSLDEEAVRTWENQAEIAQQGELLSSMLEEYQADRSGIHSPFPGMRYVLLHSLAHALIRRLCLNAGYSSSALRERIYSTSGDTPMAGLLIYTASSDSEGSLGGLVDQAAPERFGPVLRDALRDAGMCAQDPLCGAGELSGATWLNGSACHACLLLSETSCEARNRFLDRAVLADTLGQFGREFFHGR